MVREIHRLSEEMAVARRSISSDEIVEKLRRAMIEEACDILDEGNAEKPQDIELALIHGDGCPRWRGGLMYHADILKSRHRGAPGTRDHTSA